MYCRSCGKELDGKTSVCMGCGVPIGKGNSFCPACGNPTDPQAVFCVRCGVGFVQPQPVVSQHCEKSRLAAGLLGIFLGCFGAHNFYLNRTKRAVAQLSLTLSIVLVFFVFILGLLFSGIWIDVWEFFAVCILLFLLSCCCVLASFVWSMTEAILILCGATKKDGRGNPLKD